MFSQAAADNPGLPVLRTALAQMYCDLDRPDDALATIAADLADGFAHFPYDTAWLQAMVVLSDICVRLDQPSPLPSLYETLAPWHRLTASVGMTFLGPVALFLGMLAAALGNYTAAAEHFREALDVSERLQAPYWTALTQIEECNMLRQRGEPNDESRAAALLTQANDAAQRYGFAGLERRAHAIS